MDQQHDRKPSRTDEGPEDLTPDVPPQPDATAGHPADPLTGLRTQSERDPYGTEIEGADIVHSDRVAAAELSSEYDAGHAASHTRSKVEEAEKAWDEAAEDSLEGDPLREE